MVVKGLSPAFSQTVVSYDVNSIAFPSFHPHQLVQAVEGKFNPHIHVEYEWSLRLEEMDESDDDLDDKV